MTTLDKIKILKKASVAFRKKPNSALNNRLGLCDYFKKTSEISDSEIEELLGKKNYNKTSFTFGNGLSQVDLYKQGKYTNERANWCNNKLIELMIKDGYMINDKESLGDKIVFFKKDKKIIHFLNFLEEVEAFDAFQENIEVENQRWNNLENYYDNIEILKNNKPGYWIARAFNLDKSILGKDFWIKIDNKWRDIINSKENLIEW